MKTLITLLLGIVPASVLALGSAMLSGCSQSEAVKIVSVDDQSVTVENAKEGPETHVVAPDAKITLDGKPAELEDLQPGDKAEVTTQREGAREAPKEVAVVIDAERAQERPVPGEGEPAAPADTTILPQEPGLNEPTTEREAPRSGGGPATSMRGARFLNFQRGLSAVPADERPVHALHQGEITFVGADFVRLRHIDVPLPVVAEVMFLVTEETEILIDGKAAGIEDLREGMSVTIAAEQLGGLFVAERIEARPVLV